MTEATPEAATPTGRGRPRPDATLERDAKVLEFITGAGAVSRKQIAEGTGLKGNEVYLSLYRLSRSTPPAVVREGANWKVPGEVVPAAA